MPFDLAAYEKKYADVLLNYPIEVKLVDCAKNPYDLAVASARTCYSGKGIVYPQNVADSEKSKSLRDKIAKSTLDAGHMTTRQHAHFIFALNNVSRNLIWQFLHAHPYYNSEQVSQRYVAIKENNNWYSLPKILKNDDTKDWPQKTYAAYQKLIESLRPVIRELYFSVHRLKANHPDKYEIDIEKKTIEIARYVMPIATTAYMYHTISALTLHRYTRMMLQYGLDEAIALVLKMLRAVYDIDPLLVEEMPDPMPANLPMANTEGAFYANQEFDLELNKKNVTSAIVGNKNDLDAVFKRGYGLLRADLKISKKQIFDHLLDGHYNMNIADVLYPVSLDTSSRLLNHIHFTFQKKLSHTADSQEQRHRTLPGLRPLLYMQMSLNADYITPKIFYEDDKSKAIYDDFMHENFQFIEKLYKKEYPMPALSYLLPNAYPVRFLESGDLMNFLHKWKARLCYNAQEEIFYSSVDEIQQVFEQVPELKEYIGPPCFMRDKARLKPRCPEGGRFCGVKVWKQNISDYDRIL
ncbi:MAG: FAD-dependent thymidylate synthase [Spirochaetia bacterium]|nr:FAD-dependent thymidylate synthase [Spirochaetia bacterium]